MASKADRRAAARAEREAREAQEAQAAGRKRRLYLLGGAVVVAAAVVGIAIAISSGGNGSSGGGGGGTSTGASEVNAELAGIPQSGNTLGQASAPVTITEFADLQCPVCHEFNQDTLSQLIDRAILKIPTRPNPLSTVADYTSWASLTDRAWDSRHLPKRPPARRPRHRRTFANRCA